MLRCSRDNVASLNIVGARNHMNGNTILLTIPQKYELQCNDFSRYLLAKLPPQS